MSWRALSEPAAGCNIVNRISISRSWVLDMIRQMPEDEFAREFFADFADIECGRHFDGANPQHVEWVRKRITIHYSRGVRAQL